VTLIVEAPSGYPDERRYVIDVVLREWLGIDYSLRLTGVPGLVVIRAAHETRHRQLTLPDVLFATTLDDWLVARSLPVTPIRYARIDSVAPFRRRVGFSDENGTLPILYADSTPSQAGESGAAIHLGIDIFGSVFFLLSRYEEVVTRTRDKHGRFPASASVTSAFLERPLADEYVELLWAAIAHLWPDIRRREIHQRRVEFRTGGRRRQGRSRYRDRYRHRRVWAHPGRTAGYRRHHAHCRRDLHRRSGSCLRIL